VFPLCGLYSLFHAHTYFNNMTNIPTSISKFIKKVFLFNRRLQINAYLIILQHFILKITHISKMVFPECNLSISIVCCLYLETFTVDVIYLLKFKHFYNYLFISHIVITIYLGSLFDIFSATFLYFLLVYWVQSKVYFMYFLLNGVVI